jgi:hypothetical protein
MLHERFHKYLACNLCSRRERAHTRSSLPVKQLFTERKGEERASERVKPAGKRRCHAPRFPRARRRHGNIRAGRGGGCYGLFPFGRQNFGGGRSCCWREKSRSELADWKKPVSLWVNELGRRQEAGSVWHWHLAAGRGRKLFPGEIAKMRDRACPCLPFPGSRPTSYDSEERHVTCGAWPREIWARKGASPPPWVLGCTQEGVAELGIGIKVFLNRVAFYWFIFI